MAACDEIAVASVYLDLGHETHDAGLSRTAFAAILYHLVVVGEAVRSLPAEVKQKHPQAGWAKAQGMRNVVTHEYYRIDPDAVHNTIDEPLSKLRRACQALVDDS